MNFYDYIEKFGLTCPKCKSNLLKNSDTGELKIDKPNNELLISIYGLGNFKLNYKTFNSNAKNQQSYFISLLCRKCIFPNLKSHDSEIIDINSRYESRYGYLVGFYIEQDLIKNKILPMVSYEY